MYLYFSLFQIGILTVYLIVFFYHRLGKNRHTTIFPGAIFPGALYLQPD